MCTWGLGSSLQAGLLVWRQRLAGSTAGEGTGVQEYVIVMLIYLNFELSVAHLSLYKTKNDRK